MTDHSTDSYLYCEMSKSKDFRADFVLSINGIELSSIYNSGVYRSGIKIDTGARGTLIPLRTLGWTDSMIKQLIERTYNTDIGRFSAVHGVENNNRESSQDVRNMSLDELKEYRGLAIKVIADYIKIDGFEFDKTDVRVSTQTEGNMLLGMDILSIMDVHIGNSLITNNSTIIACPYDCINQDYYDMLGKHFGLGRYQA